jgi:hypothetical protein
MQISNLMRELGYGKRRTLVDGAQRWVFTRD